MEIARVVWLCWLWYLAYLAQYTCALEFYKSARFVKNLSCSRNEDCIENAVCTQLDLSNRTLQHQFCICDSGYVMFRSKSGDVCLKEASRLGDACAQDIQCSAVFGSDALCGRGGTCQCKPGATLVTSLCEVISKIGDPCVVSDNCPMDVYCDKSVCVCPYNYVANSERTKCIKNSNLGEPCNEDWNCLNTNSRCYEGRCRCSRAHVQSESGNTCLKLANNLLDRCSEDAQCYSVSPITSCILGRCECKPGHHAYNDLCWVSIGLGEYCSDSRQCISNSNITALMRCHDNRCACVAGSMGDKKLNECMAVPSSTVRFKYSIGLLMFALCFMNTL